MASKTVYWLPKFDPAADFVVAAWPQGFTVSGYQPKPGEPFDKAMIKSQRILEELYTKRWIAVAEPSAAGQPPAPTGTSAPSPQRPPTKSERKKLRQRAAA